ncbi:lactose-binding lectin l-2-like [Electrophorus electricus]|uniref:lactose-binding lectin l-2-like n=1 Tax=Electrophorus electricus TaxID=8005 RepID=UPI0015D02C87|nr:lactose-binding lectin l-2-like [Electrophorus electricus]
MASGSWQSNHIKKEYFSVNEATCSPHCTSGWGSYGIRCFKYIANSTDWVSAEKHCLKLHANLVSTHSEDEFQLVKAFIRAHDPMENPTWIGLSDCQEATKWIWSDGTELNYVNWNPSEPNHLNNECCVHTNWSDQKKWNDIPCTINYPFVCAKKPA